MKMEIRGESIEATTLTQLNNFMKKLRDTGKEVYIEGCGDGEIRLIIEA